MSLHLNPCVCVFVWVGVGGWIRVKQGEEMEAASI